MELINLNGKLVEKSTADLPFLNTALSQGLFVTEPLIYAHQLYFSEEHYFHIAASLRMLRWDIPMYFTPEFFYEQIQLLTDALKSPYLSIYFHITYSNDDTFLFWVEAKEKQENLLMEESLENIDLYREDFVNNHFYNRLPLPQPLTRIYKKYAEDNDFDDLLLQNTNKELARTLKGDIFIIEGTTLSTPAVKCGASQSVLRQKIIDVAKRAPEFDKVEETEIFPFAVNKGDEVFITIPGIGIQSYKGFRKKVFTDEYTSALVDRLNQMYKKI